MSLRSLFRLWVLVVLAVTGCNSAPRGSLAIELAPTDRCSDATDSFEAEWECLRIQICESTGGAPSDGGTADAGATASGCVEITTPGGDHEGATDALIVHRTDLVAFDARVESGREYDVSVTAYGAGGAAVAIGRTRHVSPLGGEIRVRLHRYGMSSCGGVTDGNALPAHRALGAAVALPNGDVLFFGGATGDNVDAAQLTSVARFQRVVQVYDASTSRFFDVAVTNNAEPSAPAGFGRVLFEARDFGTESDGRQRIRVFGGFGAVGADATSLRFDQNLLFTAYGLPLLPSAEPNAIAAVDILYDPVTRSATIDLVTAGGVPSTGGAGVSEVVGGRAISVGGISTNGGPTNLASPDDVLPTVSNMLGVWDASALVTNRAIGDMGVDDFGRHGATVTYLSGTSYLVWGGGLRVIPPALHTDFAGVLINAATSGVTVMPVAAPDLGPLPPPVAFHTATRLAPEHVLITGGLPITASFVRGRPPVELAPAPAGFSVLVREGGAFRSTTVTGDPRDATILHQATVLSSVGGVPTAVLLTGGALTRPFPAASSTLTTLWSSNEVGVVSGSADAWAYRVAATLRHPRFGHTTTVIDGVGVLISGGYREEIVGPAGAQQVRLQPVLEPEFFLIEDLLGLPLPERVTCDDAGVAIDAGRRDGGTDAPTSDAGVPDDADLDADLDAPI